MSLRPGWKAIVLAVLLALTIERVVFAESSGHRVEFSEDSSRITVAIDGLPIATYFFQDKRISRPYFAHIRAPNGAQITRNHPPIEGQDPTDHATLHPGIWLAFGDISGSDNWRLRAPVRHAGFVEKPRGGIDKGYFAVRNQYFDGPDSSKVLCEEVARYTFLARPAGHLLLWDSTFSSGDTFTFGDQEEMGLGVRLATVLRADKKPQGGIVGGRGTIRDSHGRINGEEVWGKTADWCDFSGTVNGQSAGVTLLCHPENFRPSWFHARDYGLLAANPFGRQAFRQGVKSSVVVRPGETLRLRYGVLLHSGPQEQEPDLSAAYEDYVSLTD